MLLIFLLTILSTHCVIGQGPEGPRVPFGELHQCPFRAVDAVLCLDDRQNDAYCRGLYPDCECPVNCLLIAGRHRCWSDNCASGFRCFNGSCIQCLADSECSALNRLCVDNRCVLPCTVNNIECSQLNQICVAGRCIPRVNCSDDRNCPLTQFCQNGICDLQRCSDTNFDCRKRDEEADPNGCLSYFCRTGSVDNFVCTPVDCLGAGKLCTRDPDLSCGSCIDEDDCPQLNPADACSEAICDTTIINNRVCRFQACNVTGKFCAEGGASGCLQFAGGGGNGGDSPEPRPELPAPGEGEEDEGASFVRWLVIGFVFFVIIFIGITIYFVYYKKNKSRV